MRKITGAAFVSLDGVMQAPGGPEEDPTGGFTLGGWMTGVFDAALGAQVDSFFAPPFDLLLGRKTYEIFAAHWPYQPEGEPIADAFRTCAKYVVTGSAAPLDWEGSHRLPGIDAVAALKARDGPNLVIQGSSTLYPPLLARGLIDRLVLMIAPMVLGRGKRLFGDTIPPARYTLVEQRLGTTGMVMATYEPAGEIELGSFAMQEPSAEELARREKLKIES